MPALSVSVDGNELATVAIGDVTMMNASLSGQRWDHDAATLRMDGGNYDTRDGQPYRIWINEVPIEAGQIVTVSCIADTPTSHAGKTIAELFPDEPPCEHHTELGEYGFTFRVMWTALHRPECARFSVSTNTVEQIQTRTRAREHLKGELFLGQSVHFQVWPSTVSD